MEIQVTRKNVPYRIVTIVLLLVSIPALQAAEKLKALIVDGQNNHKVCRNPCS